MPGFFFPDKVVYSIYGASESILLALLAPNVGFNVLAKWGIKPNHWMQSISACVTLKTFKLQRCFIVAF